MGSRMQRSAIDNVARVVSRVREAWVQGRIGGTLLVDVKSTFDHVSRNCLLQTMEKINTDGDQMLWTESFMLERSVSLIMDGHLCEETVVKTGVPQESPVSLMFFSPST